MPNKVHCLLRDLRSAQVIKLNTQPGKILLKEGYRGCYDVYEDAAFTTVVVNKILQQHPYREISRK
ncbi:MAG TPA: hypothetical protein VK369_02325 [Segetibacter sp.]|nr:hypothetical protein [Segetibacter sp.]